MANKIIMAILAVLIILSGGLSYYSYTVNQQFGEMSEQLAQLHAEQSDEITTLNSELDRQKEEILDNVGELQDEVKGNQTTIGALADKVDEIDESLIRVDTLEGELSQTQAKTETLEEEIREATDFSDSLALTTIDASQVFDKVNQATVQISDGERTIGSGFVFDVNSHIVTAHHVVEDLSEIYVVFPDGRVSTANFTGSDPASDVAVLTLDDEISIEPPVIADSSNLRVGEPVVAIGNPFDLNETLTAGVISQVNRYTDIQSSLQTRWVANLIQFDAAVNFGNSGCPLMNADGEIIGLVIARIGPEEGDGIYYAVSSNKFKRVAEAIIAEGAFDYPWLGVAISDLTPQGAQEKNLETVHGALVGSVVEDSPAESAGIEVDDIIMAIDGFTVRNIADLISYLGEYKSPGNEATISVRRNASELELSLEIGKRPD